MMPYQGRATMAAMHVITSQVVEKVQTGIRPFDVGRDLRPVANLIAEAFSHELDDRGEAALRELRALGYMSGFIGLLNRSTGEFDEIFGGFVWVDHGKVVGNVTVQRADSYGNRWQIANVAVAPAYRGRGISRILMETALAYIEEMDGRWAVLQVRANNPIALGLYERMGFENLGGTVELRAHQVPVGVSMPHAHRLRPFSGGQWRALYDLASSQYGAHTQWWRGINRSDFQVSLEQLLAEWFSQLIGKQVVHRQAIQHDPQRFEAALILTARRWRGFHNLQLWVRPDAEGECETDLVRWALATLQDFPRWPIHTSLPTTQVAAREVLESHGFQVQTTLLTMRRSIRS
jgi:ribosomal protein S18 acetylase RimI-like enzyme